MGIYQDATENLNSNKSKLIFFERYIICAVLERQIYEWINKTFFYYFTKFKLFLKLQDPKNSFIPQAKEILLWKAKKNSHNKFK